MSDFKSELEKQTKNIEEMIYSYMPEEIGYQKIIMEAMNYSMTAGGKRLRPMLMLETAKLFDYDCDEIKPFMAAIEMIHTYSLVHDDLPAMDNDDYRRGKLTTHKKFGHAMGVLAGDALLNYAYEICAKALLKSRNMERAAKALVVLSEKAGIYGMVGGQTVDVENTNQHLDGDVLQFIHELKTSALIQASMMVGAILAGADESQVEKIEKIGLLVGLAFQIQDDILDVTSTMEELGKPIRSDEKNNKTTYVNLLGLDGAKERVLAYSDQALELLDELENKNEFLVQLLMSLIHRRK